MTRPRVRVHPRPGPAALGLLALLGWPCAAGAVEAIGLQIGRLEGGGVVLAGIDLELRPGKEERSGRLRGTIAEVRLPPPLELRGSASFECALAAHDSGWRCEAGRLTLADAAGTPLAEAGLRLEVGPGELRLELTRRDLPAGARQDLVVELVSGALEVVVEVEGLEASRLAALLPPALELGLPAGALEGRLAYSRRGTSTRLDGALRARGLEFSQALGKRVGEDLGLAVEAALAREADGPWTGRLAIEAVDGAAFLDPVLLDFAQAPMAFSGILAFDPRDQRLRLREARLRQVGVGEVAVDSRLRLAPFALEALRLELAPTALEALYPIYLVPFAGVGALANLSPSGQAALAYEWGPGGASEGRLRLLGVDVEERDGRFALAGLEGEVAWAQGREPPPSRLVWREGRLYRIGLGGGSLEGWFQDLGFRLARPIVVPLLDGRFEIQHLEASGVGTPALAASLDASLTSLSLEGLTTALGWPPLAGTVAATTPRMRYADHTLDIEGILEVDVFDGRVQIRDLRLERPFGDRPRLTADVGMEGISLERLTRTFAFGNIEGRIEGRVDGLELLNWRPVAFDARFATPPGDRSRRRISQRAVENLAGLGGVEGMVTATFLGLFRDFSYERLGLSCRLRDGVCEMDGVGPANGGYYIVQGGGIPPRIDVLGFTRRVDWDTLVARLRAATAAEGPIVQ